MTAFIPNALWCPGWNKSPPSFATPSAAFFLLIITLTILGIVLIMCLAFANTITNHCIKGLHPAVLCGEKQLCWSLCENVSVHLKPIAYRQTAEILYSTWVPLSFKQRLALSNVLKFADIMHKGNSQNVFPHNKSCNNNRPIFHQLHL